MRIELNIPDKETADEFERVIGKSGLLLWQTGADAYTIKCLPPFLDTGLTFVGGPPNYERRPLR